MLKEEIMDFLRTVPPFNLLGDDDLREMTEDMSMEYYPKGVRILSQNGLPSDYLRIIKKGGVKVFMTNPEGEDIVIDFRGEGELFGVVSMVSGDRSRANVTAVEDTICYSFPRRKMMSIFEKNPAVHEYFLKSFFINFIDKAYDETRRKFSPLCEGERLLFTSTIRDIMMRQPVTAPEGITVREAAQTMAKNKISSVIVLNGLGVPVGIVTDRDLREKVVARGRDVDEPVRNIMSYPLIRVDADEYCFEALLRMIRYRIHHLLVVENGALKGVVTNHDFLMLQGSSPTVFVKQIEEAQSVEEIKSVVPKLYGFVSTLLRVGAKAGNITGLVTEILEKILNRLAGITEKKLGRPPLPYTLVFFGDAARRELTLNLEHLKLGIVYEGSRDLGLARDAENYFTGFAGAFNDAAKACGLGSGLLRQGFIKSAPAWQETASRWASEPFSEHPPEWIFDIRAVRGDYKPASSLRDLLAGLARQKEELMDYVAAAAVQNRPPIGFFSRFVVEKSGENRNELNLYRKGLKPLADAVGIFALEKDVRMISTIKKVQVLGARYGFEEALNIEHAFEYVLTLLLQHGLGQIEAGQRPDDFINPEGLATIEKKTLKEVFQLIARLYDILEKNYRTERPV